jgi:hypothetical protein
MSTRRNIEAAVGQRVYEYEGSDGATYYSFTRQPNMLSPPVKLRLKSKLGTHLTNFLVKLRRLGDALDVLDDG